MEPWAIDRLFYRSLNTKAMGLFANEAACEAIPGFRLVVVKFAAQMPIMLEMCLGHPPAGETQCTDRTRWFYVDMLKIGSNTVVKIQGNILLSDTDLTSSVMINDPYEKYAFIYAHSGKLHDESPLTWNVYPVCQANVFGVNW
ncbi:uncharacterized protein LOC108678699 [Hyalella azteca]|uniref:Uncharacterized protein LOC108678699 n=1 Tax=Hyalella azteca TaxID=294128 RepID=A0A8B7PBQ1_HYAAZ|nr:uncharacterized protein LOC108678699 [Hyalella azteca]